MNSLRIDLSDPDIINLIGEQQSQELIHFSDMAEQVKAAKLDGELNGDKLPWADTHSMVALGEGELSLWCGINGHGKSQLLMNVMASLCQTRNVLIASMEMPVQRTLLTMCSQAAGCLPSDDFIDRFTSGTDSWVYDMLEKVSEQNILGLIHYAGTNLRTNHLVIDSLTMCGIGRDNYEGQAAFVDMLRLAAKQYSMHIHLVCHMRKGSSESERANKFDIRGAGEIADMADKVFLVHRNKKREQALGLINAGIASDDAQTVVDQEKDTYLTIAKNRQDGTEGVVGLYFHKESGQFVKQEDRAMNFFK